MPQKNPFSGIKAGVRGTTPGDEIASPYDRTKPLGKRADRLYRDEFNRQIGLDPDDRAAAFRIAKRVAENDGRPAPRNNRRTSRR